MHLLLEIPLAWYGTSGSHLIVIPMPASHGTRTQPYFGLLDAVADVRLPLLELVFAPRFALCHTMCV
jgi:hypothetical protein